MTNGDERQSAVDREKVEQPIRSSVMTSNRTPPQPARAAASLRLTQRSSAMRRRTKHAFTLVELLVVIGIIALLISALLPTLNKARQAGNLVDCQARLQQMGQALNIYTAQNQARLPWGGVMNDKALAPWIDGNVPNPGNKETFWWWFFTLGEVMNK